MEDNLVTIIKNGKLINIDQGKLCRNDTVVLQAGDIAPADLKLVEATRLEVDEFDLTGEIMPVVKEATGNGPMIYMGSRIIKGTGKGIVVATGDQTEYGNVLKQVWEQNETYRFSIIQKKYFILVLMLLPALVILIQSQTLIFITVFYLLLSLIFLLLQNNGLFSYLLIKNEIKNLKRFGIQIYDEMALERMNQIDIICFDKTGVLTTRQMTVKNIYWINGAVNVDNEFNKERAPYLLKIACALCHDVSFFERIDLANPIDKALIFFAEKMGMNIKEMFMHSKRIYDMPFNSENRYMACGYELNNREVYYFAKGDPDVIIGMCDSYITMNGGAKKKVDRDFWLFNKSNIDIINQKGGTAIALAYTSDIFNKSSKEFTFLCLLQLENSLQQRAKAIISKISEKGIKSKMLTGDRAENAVKVGKDCGMMKNSAAHLVGKLIEMMPLPEVARQAEYCSVFARLLPSQKGLIIRLLQEKRHCVAMIGDGPNDGIALKVADIGISFVKNSSLIAKRLSKILIHDLDDLLRLIEGAHRIKRITKYLKLLRIILLSASLLGIYLWVLSSIKVIH